MYFDLTMPNTTILGILKILMLHLYLSWIPHIQFATHEALIICRKNWVRAILSE